jgi:hypothetical protein
MTNDFDLTTAMPDMSADTYNIEPDLMQPGIAPNGYGFYYLDGSQVA